MNLNLVEIIEACGKNGVSELEYGDVKLKFGMQNNNILAQSQPIYYNETSDSFTDNTEDPDIDENSNNITDLEELKLSDPLAYERFLSAEGA